MPPFRTLKPLPKEVSQPLAAFNQLDTILLSGGCLLWFFTYLLVWGARQQNILHFAITTALFFVAIPFLNLGFQISNRIRWVQIQAWIKKNPGDELPPLPQSLSFDPPMTVLGAMFLVQASAFALLSHFDLVICVVLIVNMAFTGLAVPAAAVLIMRKRLQEAARGAVQTLRFLTNP